MTELDLYKFIQENEVEVEWYTDELLNMWIHPADIGDFIDLLNRCDADDGGLDCKLQSVGYIHLNLLDVCEEYDINPEKILPREESK